MLESPVKIYNEYLDEVVKLPGAAFSGAFIGPVTPVVERELGTLTSVPASFDLVYEDNEEALVFDNYKSPYSKRTYITLSDEVCIEDADGNCFKLEKDQYTITPASLTITDNNIYIGDIYVSAVSGSGGTYELAVSSYITNLGHTIKVGDTITDGTNSWTITAIGRSTITVTGTTVPEKRYYQVRRTITGKVKAKYRVFKKFDEVIKIDSTGLIEEYFGTLDDQNILAWALKIAFETMQAPKALYAIPYSSQDNRTEAFERLKKYEEPGVYLIDNVILDFDEEVIGAGRLLAAELSDPKYSKPIRFFIAFDAPLYEYEWREYGGTIDALRGEIADAEESSYEGVGFSPTDADYITYASYNGRVLEFTTPIDLTAGTQYLIKFGNTFIEWTADAAYTSGDTVQITKPEALYGTLNPTVVRNSVVDGTAMIGPEKRATLSDAVWTSGDSVFLYSVVPITDINDLFSFYTSLSPNSEFINIVNPWVFKTDGTRAPGFYLAAMKAGFTIGHLKLVVPTAFWPLNRSYVWDVDYDLKFWGNLYQLVLDKGFDIHVVDNNELKSWEQRTSYYGPKIDKRYQHAVRAVIIVNYYQKAIAMPYVRKNTLDSFVIDSLLTALEQMLARMMSPETGPVLSQGSRIKAVYLIKSPEDIPQDIPVTMESGLLIVTVLRIPRMVKEIVYYNIITAQNL